MLDDIGIRTKVLAVLAVPVVVLTVASGTLVAESAARAQQTGALRALAAGADDLGLLTEALRAERDVSMLLRRPDPRVGQQQLEEARTRTTEQLAAVGTALDAVDGSALPVDARSALDAARAQVAGVPALRDAVDTPSVGVVQVRTGYRAAVRELSALPRAAALSQDDPQLAIALTGWSDAQGLIDLADTQGAQISQMLAGRGDLRSVQSTSLRREVLSRELAVDVAGLAGEDIEVPVTTDGLRQVQETLLEVASGLDAPRTDAFDPLARSLALAERLDPATVDAAVDEQSVALAQASERLAAVALERSTALEQSARRTATLQAALVTLLVVGSVAVALLIGNGIVRRLRAVTRTADAMREQLPAAVAAVSAGRGADPVAPLRTGGRPGGGAPGRDEVGRLSTALDDVEALALDLARGQAELRAAVSAAFVDVARRNQSLLGRQLSAIDSLERAEQDPGSLAALFQLDHMASRMRRNAESLLVIAGEEGGRRVRTPMPLTDVVRTAASEVEHYERVDLALHDDPQVPPHLALALAHLLAELLENATTFSPPHTRVVVTSRPPVTGEDGALVLEVADRGTGMGADDLARARARLQDPSHASLVDASRLGFTVVARLAERLGVRVGVDSREGAGTVATLVLPSSLLVGGERPHRQEAARSQVPTRAAATSSQGSSWSSVPAADAEAAGTPVPVPADGSSDPAAGGVAPAAARAAAAPAADLAPSPGTRSGRHRSDQRRSWVRRSRPGQPEPRPEVPAAAAAAGLSAAAVERLPRAATSTGSTAPVPSVPSVAPAPAPAAAPVPAAAALGTPHLPAPPAVVRAQATAAAATASTTASTTTASTPAASTPAGPAPAPTSTVRSPTADHPTPSLPWSPTLAYRTLPGTTAEPAAAAAVGLPRRHRAARGGGPVAAPAVSDLPVGRAAGDAATRERAPEAVRSALAGYRAGVVRARGEGVGEEQPAAEGLR